MVGWLIRATEGFRRQKPPPPEPYNVKCDCGANVIGDRTASAQRPACPSCSRPVFVLPRNVYPVSSKPVRRDEPPKSKTNPKTNPNVAPKTGEKPAGNLAVAPQEPTGVLVEARSAVFTPFRLVVAAIIIIVGLTGWGLSYRSRVEAARSGVLMAKEAGLKALQEGDFITASRELKRARNAVDLLGRFDDEAMLIRRACREAVAGNDLSSSGIFELLSESAGRNRAKGLDGKYQNSWILFDSIILLPTEKSQPCVLDMPIVIDKWSYRIEIHSKSIQRAAEQSGEGSQGRVIFAARPSSIRQEEGRFVLTLDGPSAFLWSDFGTYSHLGYREPNFEEQQLTRDLLERQRIQVEEAR